MNKSIAYTILLYVGLFLGGIPVAAQSRHYIDVWAGGGYDALLHGMEHTRVPGGGGFNAGVGYELNANMFLLQTGAEFQYFGSKTRLEGYSEDYTLRYDDGRAQTDMLYQYNFLEYTERHRAGYVNIPLLLGVKFDRYYALVGTRVGLNLLGSFASDAQIHLSPYDPAAIEDFGRKYPPFDVAREGGLDLGLNVTASAEFGVTLDEWLPRNMTRLNNQRRTPVSYRAGVFVDYGLTNLNKAGTASRLVQPQTDESGLVADPLVLDYAHLPASTLAEGHPLHNLYAGVKLTVQFDLTKKRRKPSRPAAEPMPFYAHVTDAATQADLAGVDVTARLGSRTVFKQATDAAGMVMQPELRRGRYTLSVQQEGYQNFRKTVPHYRADTVEIALQPVPDFLVRVYDAKSGTNLAADVELTRPSDNSSVFKGMTDAASGLLECDVRAGRYQIYVDAKGYIYQQSIVELAASDTLEFALQPIEKDVKVVLHNLFFALNSAEILPESTPALEDLHLFLQQNETVKIHIVGHTDNTGTMEYNMQLSEARAKAVYDAIVARGIAADRLTYEGRGPNEPVATNDTEEGRAANRRVEFVIK